MAVTQARGNLTLFLIHPVVFDQNLPNLQALEPLFYKSVHKKACCRSDKPSVSDEYVFHNETLSEWRYMYDSRSHAFLTRQRCPQTRDAGAPSMGFNKGAWEPEKRHTTQSVEEGIPKWNLGTRKPRRG